MNSLVRSSTFESFVCAIACLLLSPGYSFAQDSSDERLLSLLTAEDRLNESFGVHYRLRYGESVDGLGLEKKVEVVGRLIRSGTKTRVDNFIGVETSNGELIPQLTEATVFNGAAVHRYDSVSRIVKNKETHDVGESMYPIPMPFGSAFGTVSLDYKPNTNLTSQIFADAQELDSIQIAPGREKSLYFFPRTSSGAMLFTYEGPKRYLPTMVELKISPNAKPIAGTPSVAEALKWENHCVSFIEWMELESDLWVPGFVQKDSAFGGRRRELEIDYAFWSKSVPKDCFEVEDLRPSLGFSLEELQSKFEERDADRAQRKKTTKKNSTK